MIIRDFEALNLTAANFWLLIPNLMLSLNLSIATLAHGISVELGSLNLLQTHVTRCTNLGGDPFAHGEGECCPGLKLRNLNGFMSCEETCSKKGDDPYAKNATGIFLECCSGLQECQLGHLSVCSDSCTVHQEASCLCVFDLDRTLTAKQGSAKACPRTKDTDLFDKAYGTGNATLSALAAAGIDTTFCRDCYLGICSSGVGGGKDSEWNQFILNNIMRTRPQDHLTERFPFVKDWSWGGSERLRLSSPFVLHQPAERKPMAIEAIRKWYESTFNFVINKDHVHFFDDSVENIQQFKQEGIQAKEVSCASRFNYNSGDSIGVCGALPEEIVASGTSGPSLCDEAIPSTKE